jgi:hypothetical protein
MAPTPVTLPGLDPKYQYGYQLDDGTYVCVTFTRMPATQPGLATLRADAAPVDAQGSPVPLPDHVACPCEPRTLTFSLAEVAADPALLERSMRSVAEKVCADYVGHCNAQSVLSGIPEFAPSSNAAGAGGAAAVS